MNQQEIEKQLLLILQESEKLKESCDIQCATTDFLTNEAEKLEAKAKDTSLSFEEKELLSKQIQAMQSRLANEIKIIDDSIPKMDELQSKLDNLIELAKKI